MMRNFFKLIEFQVVTSCRKPSARLISAAHPIPAPGSGAIWCPIRSGRHS